MENTYSPGDKVDLIILRKTDLGFVAEINGADEGLLYYDEVFKDLKLDQALTGYIKKVRRDGGIDLLLESFGHLGTEDLGEQILEVLKKRGGKISLNAKSEAEEIYSLFGVSKKKFKMALGGLYKKRLVEFTEAGTELVS